MTDILAGNTDPKVNPFWGQFKITEGKRRRPATLKTGTNNDARDLNAYGYIGAPSTKERANGEYALAVGAWNGNSDNSLVCTASGPAVLDRRDDARLAGLPRGGDRRLVASTASGSRTRSSRRPVDPWTGLAAVGGKRVTELFLDGTDARRRTSRRTSAAARPCSRAPASRTSTSRGWRPTRAGWPGRSAGPGCAAGPRTRGPPTSTTRPSTRTADPGDRSWARARAARHRRRARRSTRAPRRIRSRRSTRWRRWTRSRRR